MSDSFSFIHEGVEYPITHEKHSEINKEMRKIYVEAMTNKFIHGGVRPDLIEDRIVELDGMTLTIQSTDNGIDFKLDIAQSKFEDVCTFKGEEALG